MFASIPPAVISAIATLALAAASNAGGEIITVNIALDDTSDFGGAQTVSDLPGPDGKISLREAVTAANNTPGPQTIAFAIPTSEFSIFASDRAIIRLEASCIVSDDDTTIDFTTQTTNIGDTNPNGNEVGLQYAGVPAAIPCLWLNCDHSVIKGLDMAFGNNVGNTIWITGNYNQVKSCTTNGLSIKGYSGGGRFNVIGGTEPGDGNTFSEECGIFSGASGNVVVGNIIRWGFRIAGDTLYGTCDNNRIGGPTPAERNNLAGKGRFGEEGLPLGTQLEIQHAVGTVVENNYVGTTPDGMAKLPGKSGTVGISVYTGAVGTVIRNNVVSGIEMTGIDHYDGQRFGTGITVGATAAGTVMTGNRVGVAAEGITPILNVNGIAVYSDPNGTPTNTHVGTGVPADGNLVAFNERVGISVQNQAVGVRIQGNSIASNGSLGIDLVPAGAAVNPNDAGDADTGANGLQNYPVLQSATNSAGVTTVEGTLNSVPNQSYTIEFFANGQCDPSGFGEGEVLLGSTAVTTNASGNASFSAVVAAAAEGSAVTSTATRDASGDTSEFSACVALVMSRPPADLNGDGAVDGADLGMLLGQWGTAEGAADLNGDGVVDGADLGALLGSWTR